MSQNYLSRFHEKIFLNYGHGLSLADKTFHLFSKCLRVLQSSFMFKFELGDRRSIKEQDSFISFQLQTRARKRTEPNSNRCFQNAVEPNRTRIMFFKIKSNRAELESTKVGSIRALVQTQAEVATVHVL